MSVFPDKNPEILRVLQARLQKISSPQRPSQAVECAALTRIFPEGIPRGGIVEWLGDTGNGVTTLSFWMAQQLCQDQGIMVIVDRQQQIYPPALTPLGIDLNRTIWLRPGSRQDEIWALIQCLRCPSITVVWSYLEQLNAREYRCLQLAAESNGVVGIFSRPTRIQGQPTWASTRLSVIPQLSGELQRFVIKTHHCCQGLRSNAVTIERDALTGKLRECHETFPVRLATRLASSPVSRRAARA